MLDPGARDGTGAVLVSERGPVLVISINRPACKNAVDLSCAEQIEAAVDYFEETPALRCAILTGEGDFFSAGADLKAMATSGQRPITPRRGALGLASLPPSKPIIAAVQGPALGGGFEAVLACDLVIAADSAYFALPEVRRGQIAGGGGVVRLPRLIPRHVAAEIVLTGRPISAARAEKLGLVNQVVQRNAVLPTAVTLAEEIAANAPLAVAASKHLLYSSLDWPPSQALHNQEPHVRSVRDSADAAEGARAFAEKRQPIWEGA